MNQFLLKNSSLNCTILLNYSYLETIITVEMGD